MLTLTQWAIKWGLPDAALVELREAMGAVDTDPNPAADGDESEAATQTRVRLEASAKGLRLWRNNVGGAYAEDGSFFRYGLCNDSKAMNLRIKSHDLIGIRPVEILPSHVGQRFGQFISREVKRPGWTYKATPREQAQLRFAELILSLGGDAAFTTGEGSL